MRRPALPLCVILALGLAGICLPGCATERESGVVLRMAITQEGERLRGPFREAVAAYEREHPGVRVKLMEMDGDVYQKMGLLTLFVGGTPPDVYFQWGGHLVRKYAAAGYALDLTGEFPEAERRRYLPTCWASCRGEDGRVYLWPNTASLTTVMWYRKSLFRDAGVRPPNTWSGFLTLCEQLKARGIIPIAVGNRELWPGGNFAAARSGTEEKRYVRTVRRGSRPRTRPYVSGTLQLRQTG